MFEHISELSTELEQLQGIESAFRSLIDYVHITPINYTHKQLEGLINSVGEMHVPDWAKYLLECQQ